MTKEIIYKTAFIGKWVVYMTVIDDDNFMSVHNREGLSDENANHYFAKAHYREVEELKRQKKLHAN